MEKKTVFEKIMEAFMDAKKRLFAGEEMHVYFSENNGKTNMPTIDLLPLITCHGRCRRSCGKIEKGKCLPPCYACKYVNRFPKVMKHYAENTVLALYRPDQYWSEIREKMTTCNSMRLFGSGDMIINGYFKSLCDALKENPNCHIQGFTKCFEIVADYIDRYGMYPKNLHLLESGWYDEKPINPHRVPETNVYDDEKPAQWLGCCGDCSYCRDHSIGCWGAKQGQTVGFKKH